MKIAILMATIKEKTASHDFAPGNCLFLIQKEFNLDLSGLSFKTLTPNVNAGPWNADYIDIIHDQELSSSSEVG